MCQFHKAQDADYDGRCPLCKKEQAPSIQTIIEEQKETPTEPQEEKDWLKKFRLKQREWKSFNMKYAEVQPEIEEFIRQEKVKSYQEGMNYWGTPEMNKAFISLEKKLALKEFKDDLVAWADINATTIETTDDDGDDCTKYIIDLDSLINLINQK
jgi:hypothetical protein